MKLKSEQVEEIQAAVSDALNDMVPHFMGSDIKSMLTSSMEASIGHIEFPDGRTASIALRVEIEVDEVVSGYGEEGVSGMTQKSPLPLRIERLK